MPAVFFSSEKKDMYGDTQESTGEWNGSRAGLRGSTDTECRAKALSAEQLKRNLLEDKAHMKSSNESKVWVRNLQKKLEENT